MNIKLTLFRWLPQAFFITALCFLVYISIQQDMRSSANDPQIQIAEDAATALSNGAAVSDVTDSIRNGGYNIHPNDATGLAPSQEGSADVTDSLQPFIFIFDQSGNVIASSATIGDTVPAPPVGVFTYAASDGEDRFTWQPIPQARIAAVLVKVPTSTNSNVASSSNTAAGASANALSAGTAGFVLAGRSLREVEIRENDLLDQVALGWLIILILSFGYSIFKAGNITIKPGGVLLKAIRKNNGNN